MFLWSDYNGMRVWADVIDEAIAELFEGMGMRIGRNEGIEGVFY